MGGTGEEVGNVEGGKLREDEAGQIRVACAPRLVG